MIELIAEPRVMKKWEEFLAENPAYSIALDGYVIGAPRYNDDKIKLNLNHHEEVDRLSTFSTSMQAYIKIKMGLFENFRFNNEPHAHIYVNDPDQDTGLAVYILKNHEKILKNKNNSRLEELLDLEQKLDITGGLYPVDTKSEIMENVAWIFDPYVESRSSGRLYSMNGKEMEEVIDDTCARIENFNQGKAQRLALDDSYEILFRNEEWAMIEEKTIHARTRLAGDGIRAFVSFKHGKNGFVYTLAKISEFIPFPITRLYKKLNDIEGISENDNDKWGGSNLIGGSPRKNGSRIDPEHLVNIINSEIQ